MRGVDGEDLGMSYYHSVPRSSYVLHELAFLVGGFAASPYLFAQLKAKLAENNISLSRPESST